MKFRTELFVPPGDFKISHSDSVLMMGSCFVENISAKMSGAGFNIDANPFGAVYNPLSLSLNLNRLMDGKPYAGSELFRDKDLFHSFAHHSRFSGTNLSETLEKINLRLEHSSAFLRKSTLLVITFGTSFVYRLQETGAVISNCHKLPAHLFIHERMCLDDIVTEWNNLIGRLKKFAPGIKILFTVSPLRYLKDGFHENQLSKATLLLAIEKLIRETPDAYYFPSYEIVMDDLRDYRFYAEDLIHPSSQAIDYIWEKFSDAYFDEETQKIVREFESIERALNHKPFYPESEEYKSFIKKIEERKNKYSYICTQFKSK
ncbi:MAG: GSCFA domain-containing protein [Candidatus Symbiothrix sp.]|nr:GSCFA domain-containing protein [Candidatus Symbiothrix sp.]